MSFVPTPSPTFGPLRSGLPGYLAGQLGPGAGNVSSLYTGAAPAAGRGFMNPGLADIWAQAVQPSLGAAPAIGRTFPRTALTAGTPPAGMIGYTFPGAPNPLASAGTGPRAVFTGANPASAGANTVTGTTTATEELATQTGKLGGLKNTLFGKGGAGSLIPKGSYAAKAGLIKAGIPMVAGELASSAIQGAFPDNETASAAADMAKWGGIGASAGALIPVPGAPLIAGGTAALAAGLMHAFGGGGDKADYKKVLSDYASTIGVEAGPYTTQLDLFQKIGMPVTDAEGKVTGTTKDPQQIAQTLAGQMQTEYTQAQAQTSADIQQQLLHEQDLKYSLAAQTQARDYFAPYLNQMVSAGQAQHDTLMKLADQAPSEYRGVFQAQAANALNTSQSTAGAYAGQISLMPTMEVINAYDKRRQDEMADVAKIYTAAAQIKSQSGSGDVDFSKLGG